MWIAWVFLIDAGTQVWKTDEDIPELSAIETDYMEANGFYGRVTLFDTEKGVCCFEIDPARTKFADFYMWTDFLSQQKEIPKGCDIWRPFFWIGSRELGTQDEWDWDCETCEVGLGPFGTAHDIWQVLRNTASIA